MAFLGTQIDFFPGIKEHLTVQLDMSLVGLHDARDTTEGHTLATAGGAQDARHAVRCLKLRLQRKATQLFSDIHIQ